jgi:hypothetical protein
MVASVLLNFANGVDFTPTDPLMGMVRTGAKLLSYDLLSVGHFSDMGTEDEKRGYIRKKVAQLRNILEDRSLSSEDQGERIRLIVILDFKPWNFLKPKDADENDEFDAAFPSLKLDYVKETVNKVFGDKNPLLRRFDYNVLFVDDNRDEERSVRYRLTAYHGYCSSGNRRGCLSTSSFCLNNERKIVLEKMNHPDANMALNHPALKTVYNPFLAKLRETLDLIKEHIRVWGKEEAFADAADKALALKTVKDFSSFDYDGELRELIRDVVGLGANRFCDCTCFIMNMRQSIASQRSRDDIALKSLVQLLCTMDEEQYRMQFKPLDDNDFHKLFITSDPDDDDIKRIELLHYFHDISALGSQIGGPDWWNPESPLTGMNWDSSKEVKYNAYQAKKANTEGSHEGQNEIVDEVGNEKQKVFRKVRRVPFFFGKRPGDWQWYREVTRALDDCLSYERNNNRPLVENLTRVDDSELPKTTVVTNYGELGVQIEKYTIKDIQSKVDYETYILNRKGKIEQLAKRAEDMKKELVKLGFRSRLIWILFLSSLAFTLCYSYHFFYVDSVDHPIWIAAGFMAICLILTAGTFISQMIVKNKINAVYGEIDKLFYDLRKLAEDHLKSVNQLATEMNEADANRKTLSEMKAKYGEWNKHNKKVETWVNYARNMKLLLKNLLADVTVRKADEDQINDEVTWTVDDTILEGKPSVVAQIWSQDCYSNMKPNLEVTNQSKKNVIRNVTCFISQFKFVCIQK